MSDNNAALDQRMKLLYGLLNSHIMSRLIYSACKFRIPDILKDGHMDYRQIAEKVGVHRRSLYRIMRTLCTVNVFSETKEGVFKLGEIGRLLRTDIPESQHALAVLMWEPWWRQGWDELLYCLETGNTGFDHVHGKRLFEYLKQNSDAAGLFNRAMTSITMQEIKAVLDAYDFSGIKKIADIGGGHGKLLAAVLKKHPAIQGILFDLPIVLDAAKTNIERGNLLERCELISGNFFEPLSMQSDIYMLKSVIHDWNDEQAILILKNCRRSINKNGRLLIIERIIPPGNELHPAKLMDIVMLVNLGGQERTASEYESLLGASGFKLNNIIGTNSAMSIIEGIPKGG